MAVILISLALLLILRVPVGFCLMLSAVSYIFYVGNIPWAIMTQRLVAGLDCFTLMAVPFFILAGKFMNAAKITDRLFDFARALVGHIPGGLGHANIVASIFFAGMSGAAVADAGGLGSIEIEAMKKDGYAADYAGAVTAASSTIGPIIPPSIPMIVFAVFAETSVAALFAAGIIPGLIMGLFLMILVYRHAIGKGIKRHPMISFFGLWRAFFSAIPPLLTPLILVGGIMGGFFTPTEAGAVAALYSLILGAFFYKTLDLPKIKEVILDSAWTTATVMLIAMAASLFAYVITLEKIPVIAGELILSLTDNRYLIFLIINIFLLFVGCFLEPVSAMIILIPVFIPLCRQMDISMIHFGVLMVLNLMIGLLTPPVGLVLYVVSDVANVPFERLVRTTFPFLLPLLICLAIVTYFEDVCLWLPRLLGLV
jgi:tripartite ATP-independent transporter DctM subunit